MSDDFLTDYNNEFARREKAEFELAEARNDLEREQKGWHVELCYDDGDHPFRRESLQIVDVGVSDRCYVVESKVLNKYIKDNKRLREAGQLMREALEDVDAQGMCANSGKRAKAERAWDTESE